MGCLSSVSIGHVRTIWPGWAGYTGTWCPANQARLQKPTVLPRAAALGIVVIANFSVAYTNPGPTLKVCLPASDITLGELVDVCVKVGKKGTETAQVNYTATQRTHICFLSDKQRTKQIIVSDPPVYFNVLLLDKCGCSGRK